MIGRVIVTIIISISVFACSKNGVNTPVPINTVDSPFVGKWVIYESVDQSAFTRWHVATDTFYSTSFKATDSTFGLVQSNRVPIPDWVRTGATSADTLYMKPVEEGRALVNNYQGNIGTYAANKDTLNFTYFISGPIVSSGDGSVYWVTQQWVKK